MSKEDHEQLEEALEIVTKVINNPDLDPVTFTYLAESIKGLNFAQLRLKRQVETK